SQPLGAEHAQLVAGFGEESEFGHEAFGIEGPALTVTGGPADMPAPFVQRSGEIGRLSHLEMMARNTFVIDRRLLLPGRELRPTLGHRPPHSSRTAEVFTGLGVVDGSGG